MLYCSVCQVYRPGVVGSPCPVCQSPLVASREQGIRPSTWFKAIACGAIAFALTFLAAGLLRTVNDKPPLLDGAVSTMADFKKSPPADKLLYCEMSLDAAGRSKREAKDLVEALETIAESYPNDNLGKTVVVLLKATRGGIRNP